MTPSPTKAFPPLFQPLGMAIETHPTDTDAIIEYSILAIPCQRYFPTISIFFRKISLFSVFPPAFPARASHLPIRRFLHPGPKANGKPAAWGCGGPSKNNNIDQAAGSAEGAAGARNSLIFGTVCIIACHYGIKTAALRDYAGKSCFALPLRRVFKL